MTAPDQGRICVDGLCIASGNSIPQPRTNLESWKSGNVKTHFGRYWQGIVMALLIQKPTTIQAAGHPPKLIEEFVGRVNSGSAAVSIARMKSPSGWSEPGQMPEFDEYTVVLRGSLHVKLKDKAFDVVAGQAIIVNAGEWVQYSSPLPEGAEYIAVCLPAFSPETVHRDESG